MRKFFKSLPIVAGISALSALPAFAQVSTPSIDTTGLDALGTSILAALAVVAGVGLLISMLRKA